MQAAAPELVPASEVHSTWLAIARSSLIVAVVDRLDFRHRGDGFLLWFFLGYLGAHRFYAGRTVTAIVQLMLSLIGGALAFPGVGFLFIGLVGIWLFVDIFLLPSMIRSYNLSLAGRLG